MYIYIYISQKSQVIVIPVPTSPSYHAASSRQLRQRLRLRLGQGPVQVEALVAGRAQLQLPRLPGERGLDPADIAMPYGLDMVGYGWWLMMVDG